LSPEDDQLPLRHDLLDPLDRDQQPPTAEEAGSYFQQLGLDRPVEAQTVDFAELTLWRFDAEAFAAVQPVVPAVAGITRITGVETGHASRA
jgi:hypothetical protein